MSKGVRLILNPMVPVTFDLEERGVRVIKMNAAIDFVNCHWEGTGDIKPNAAIDFGF